MVPTHRDASDSRVRDHLIAWYVDLRQMFVNIALKGSDEELARYTRAHWTPMIDALLGGEAVTFSRYELPSDHPQAPPHGGHPSDLLTLGADDVLRVAGHTITGG